MEQIVGWQVLGFVVEDDGKSKLHSLGEAVMSREVAERLAVKEEKGG